MVKLILSLTMLFVLQYIFIKLNNIYSKLIISFNKFTNQSCFFGETNIGGSKDCWYAISSACVKLGKKRS